MKKKCYDFRPDVLNIILTAIFSGITAVLMLVSTNYEESSTMVSSVSKRGFLFTPAGTLIVLGCVAILVIAFQSFRSQKAFPYMLVPVSVIGILYALKPVLIQGDISLFLELSGANLCIALVRSILGILVVVLLLLLVTNVVPDKKYLMITLATAILWYIGTGSQSVVLLSQIAYYFSVMFFAFNIRPISLENDCINMHIN